MSFKKLIISIFFITFFLNTEALAVNQNTQDATLTPDKKLLFSIKRLVEKGMEWTKFSKGSKAGYYKDLTKERFAELDSVVKNKLLGEVQNSSQRFSSQVGVLSDFLQANKSELIKEKEGDIKLLKDYKQSLQGLRDYFPANSSYWMLVQHSINSIDLNLEKLK